MQGLGKTVTTIALLVSNHVEPQREWSRVQVDLTAPKHKRLKWEKPTATDNVRTPDANSTDEQENNAGRNASKLATAAKDSPDVSLPTQKVTEPDAPQTV
jgi:hypothetical protein